MARPTRDPADVLTYRLNVRLTDAEGQQLTASAAAAGLTVSDYVRGLAVQAQPRQKKASPERAELIRALGQLGHIRADINQLLKDRHSGKYVFPERVDAAFKAIEAIADHLHHNLEHER